MEDPAKHAKLPTASFTNSYTNGTLKPTSKQGSATSLASAALADGEIDEATNFSEDLLRDDRSAPRCESGDDEERRQHNPPSSRRASAAVEEIAAALARGTVEHSQDVAPESFQAKQECQRPESNHSEHVAELAVLNGDAQRHVSQPSAEFTTSTTIPGGEEAVSGNNVTELPAGVNIDHKDARQPDVNLSIEEASPDFESNRGFDKGGGSIDHNNNSGIVDGGTLRTATAPTGEPSTRADSEDGRLQRAPATAAAVEGDKSASQINQKSPSEAKPSIREGKPRSHVENPESMHGSIARNSDDPRQDRKIGAGSRRRSSDRRGNTDDRGVRGESWGEMGAEGDAHAVRIDPEREAEGVAERNRRPSSSVNQDLLQSPPMLSRRTSGRGSQSLMGFNSTVRSCRPLV